jgi:hypothetical protein
MASIDLERVARRARRGGHGLGPQRDESARFGPISQHDEARFSLMACTVVSGEGRRERSGADQREDGEGVRVVLREGNPGGPEVAQRLYR